MAKQQATNRAETEDITKTRWRWSPHGLLSAVVEWICCYRLMTVLLVVALVAGVSVSWLMLDGVWLGRALLAGRGATLDEALRLLDERSLGKARDLVKNLAENHQLSDGELTGPAFVLGAVAAYEADFHKDSQFRARLYVPAAKYLGVSRGAGFPAGREAEGMFLLGRSLYYSRQQAESLLVLQEALSLNSPYAAEIHELLARLHYQGVSPDLGLALQHIRQCLESRHLSAEERDECLLLQSHILLEMGDGAASSNVLAGMSSAEQVRAESFIVQGCVSLREGDATVQQQGASSRKVSDGCYSDALNSFRQVQVSRSVPERSARRSAYLMGVAYRKLGDLRAAQEQFGRVVEKYGPSGEAVIAALEKAEVLSRLQQHEEAIKAYREALLMAGPGETFENDWVSLSHFVARVQTAYEDNVSAKRYSQAVLLAKSLSLVVLPSHSLLLLADAQQAWVGAMSDEVDRLSHFESAELRQSVAELQRELGATYERLARFRFATREYPQDVLRSAEAFLAAGDFAAAERQYREYLQGEPTARRGNALVGLGRSLMSLGRLEEAVIYFRECVDFHGKDPAIYRARLFCAEALVRQGRAGEARDLLDANLFRSDLTPESTEWRDSLFDLGHISYEGGSSVIDSVSAQLLGVMDTAVVEKQVEGLERRHKSLQQAVRYLGEAVERYPSSPRSVPARYEMAEAYRLSTRLPEFKAVLTSIDEVRVALRQEVLRYLGRSLEVYVALIDDLEAKQVHGALSELEQRVQRNCYFGRGYVLSDMGRSEDAITALLDVSGRYRRRPETIEVFVEIAGCYRRLDRHEKARGVLEQARELLGRMGPEVELQETTRYSHEEWIEYLDWMATL